jgi:hypothetical protein
MSAGIKISNFHLSRQRVMCVCVNGENYIHAGRCGGDGGGFLHLLYGQPEE